VGSEQDSLVFYSLKQRATDPSYRAFVARVLRAIRWQSGVASVVSPYGAPDVRSMISADGHAAVGPVGLSGDARSRFVRAADWQNLVAR
jgi:hypothetical protein